MTLAEVESTRWAKKFKAYFPADYGQAIALAQMPNLEVELWLDTNESPSFAWKLATKGENNECFWLATGLSNEEARALAAAMGWRLV